MTSTYVEAMRRRQKVTNTLATANSYLQGKRDLDYTVKRLRNHGSFGFLLAGELLLEQALIADPSMSDKLLEDATHCLHRAIRNNFREDPDTRTNSRDRAAVRITELDLVKSVFIGKKLPSRPAVKIAYEHLTAQALAITDGMRSNNWLDPKTSSDQLGLLGEVDSLLLGWRADYKEYYGSRRLPLQSSFSEGTGGNCLIKNKTPRWDQNVFRPGSHGQGVKLDQKIEIRHFRTPKPHYPGVRLLTINTDLAIRAGEMEVADTIARHCAFELEYPERSERLTQELDARTMLWLAKVATKPQPVAAQEG